MADRYQSVRPILAPVTTADDPVAPVTAPPQTPAVPAATPSQPPVTALTEAATAPRSAPLATPAPQVVRQRVLRVPSGIRISQELKERLMMRKVHTGEDLQDFAERVFDEALRRDGF